MVGAIADPASQEKFPITLKSRIEVICNITELFHNTNKSYKEKYLQKMVGVKKLKCDFKNISFHIPIFVLLNVTTRVFSSSLQKLPSMIDGLRLLKAGERP